MRVIVCVSSHVTQEILGKLSAWEFTLDADLIP